MWLLHRLQHKGLSKSFSSFDTRDYAATMADVKLPPGTKVYLGDVKNMYTNIKKGEGQSKPAGCYA